MQRLRQGVYRGYPDVPHDKRHYRRGCQGADKTTEFTVPQTVTSDGVTYTVTAIGENAFKWSDATKIVLPSTIDSIKNSAFDASDLAEINLPDGLTYIGKYAFDGVKMTEFVCPKGLKKIEGSAFFTAKALKSITFNDGLEEIGESCFYRASITKAILPENLKVLGAKAFLYCGELTGVKLPSTLTQIGAGTFYQCKKLASVDIPAGVESIGDDKWVAILGSDKKSVRIWASDYDGYTMSFKPETETDYFLIIPAGIVKDAAGNMNERIVLTWHGPAKPKAAEVVSTSPAVGATVKPGYMDMAFDITFSSNITIEKAKPAAILWKGEINGGSKEDPDDCWMATKQSDGQTVRIWGADYDMFTQSFKAVKGTTYNFVLPAGVIKDAEGNLNAEIVITFKCDEGDGVDSISGEAAIEVARYDLQGRPVGSSHTGLTIVRMSDGSVRKVVVK